MINDLTSQGYYVPTKALAISILALILLVAVRKFSASKRHAIAVAGLLCLVFLPLAGALLPQRPVVLPSSVSSPVVAIATETVTVRKEAVVSRQPSFALVSAPSSTAPRGPEFELYIWLTVTLLIVGRLVVGAVTLAKWAGSGESLHQPHILRSSRVKVPMTAWLGRPLIFLPWDAGSWDLDRLNRVVTHENAHIERKDWLWNLLGQIVCAIYWPLPTVWILQRIAKGAAERACDDHVLASGSSASDYAQDLLLSAKDMARTPPATAMPLITKAELVSRIHHILDPRVKRGPVGIMLLVLTIIGAVALCLPLAGTRFLAGDDWLRPAHRLSGQSSVARSNLPTMPRIRFLGADGRLVGLQFPERPPATSPALRENGFVGTLTDGRQVELVQIQHFTGKRIQTWDGFGNPILNAPVYGPKTCNEKRGRVGLVFRLIRSPQTAESQRTTIDYYDVAQIKTKSEFDYYPEDQPPTSLTAVRLSPSGEASADNDRIRNVHFTLQDVAGKDAILKGQNRVPSTCSLAFEITNFTSIDRAEALSTSGTRYSYSDAQRNPRNPLYIKLYFAIPPSEIDRFLIETPPIHAAVKVRGIALDSILSQLKEEDK